MRTSPVATKPGRREEFPSVPVTALSSGGRKTAMTVQMAAGNPYPFRRLRSPLALLEHKATPAPGLFRGRLEQFGGRDEWCSSDFRKSRLLQKAVRLCGEISHHEKFRG
jgi:hypothetical protein